MEQSLSSLKKYLQSVLTIAEYPEEKITGYIEKLSNNVLIGAFLNLPKDKSGRKIYDLLEKEDFVGAVKLMRASSLPKEFEGYVRDEVQRFFPEFATRIKEVAYGPARPQIQAIIDEFQIAFKE